MNKHKFLLPIGEISKKTGIPSPTIRSWEERYQLLNPKRTESGYRLYSNEDIEKINQIQRLILDGIPISQIKPFLNITKKKKKFKNYWAEHIDTLLSAIINYDIHALEEAYNFLLSLYSIDTTTQKVIIPLLNYLGIRWKTTPSAIAEEHFFSVYLRNKIGARLHHEIRKTSKDIIVLACLPEETHEFGLLLFGLYCVENNLHPVILGTNLPIEQLIYVQEKLDVQAFVLCGKINNEICKTLNTLMPKIKSSLFIHLTNKNVNMQSFLEKKFNHIHFLNNDFLKSMLLIKKQIKLKKRNKI